MKRIHFVYSDQGSFDHFLDSLSDKDVAKLLRIMGWVQEKGIMLAIQMKWIKKLEDNLYELRSQQGNGIQRVIYFHLEGSEYVITHGFTKKTVKTPASEIKRGRRIRRLYIRKDDH
ncbi:type II toxin-antitoxin system RelE/ParE family toxin [Lactobacillus sp. ZJLC29-4]|uniref:Type II toxin-antitoxin system RelE/ParE family toxin n=2 Tax=Levilactobacillus tujiorum TaxID=2912243 RepID=A0ABX1L1Z0_9LACO|nr:type II toxin-antitoxin system RelE/ParE family toxin [Levilactobacillus tujiorum]MCH5464152.1 type II toxin-antitoxin system RelE/ParE family toxin [Levilactobacillus tujiorum]NLR12652.1 type II toxin-antitoxin system RelE/ParE family toxin [Lactobacillus sp. HBUAS51387]NLR29056.1 type II toxin-antitoxin system RelE/ParE family toxin [Levilactobacillus tujiorum]